jgi:hypothetical protein
LLRAAEKAYAGAVSRDAAALAVPGGAYARELEASPVFGDGDKVCLPQGALEALQGVFRDPGNLPITVRVAWRRPGGGGKLRGEACREAVDEARREVGMQTSEDMADGDDGDDSDDSDSASSSDSDSGSPSKPSLLRARLRALHYERTYLSLTHAGVVEFTAEPGTVGLPRSVAKRLLEEGVPGHRKPPPPPAADPADPEADPKALPEWSCELCSTANPPASSTCATCSAPKPPPSTSAGKPAFGRFPTPAAPLLVSLVRLPKGTSCKLVPSVESLTSGFLELPDVKLTLEQSLIRTRTTLSVGDTVTIWHRGRAFDLKVESVSPGRVGAVCCVDADVEVDIGENKEFARRVMEARRQAVADAAALPPAAAPAGFAGAGNTLAGPAPPAPAPAPLSPPPASSLPPPPPAGGLRVLVRLPTGASVTHTFDAAKATLADVYAMCGADPARFRLVERFPRKVHGDGGGRSLGDLGWGGAGSLALILESAK